MTPSTRHSISIARTLVHEWRKLPSKNGEVSLRPSSAR
jgi:hypothetical protein